MAKSAQEQDTALGAELIRNDKWLNWNILRADEWATGTGEQLLSGSAWRRFCERLWALDDIQPGQSSDRRSDARGRLPPRRVLVRNAFDVALEDWDPRHPTIRWADRRKIGWDCPDAIYATIPIQDDGVYRCVAGAGTSTSSGFRSRPASARSRTRTPTSGTSTPTVASSSCSAGRRARATGPIEAGACWIFVRQFFYDWETEQTSPLWIDRIDDAPDVPRAASSILPHSRGSSTPSRRTSKRASSSGSAPSLRCASAS